MKHLYKIFFLIITLLFCMHDSFSQANNWVKKNSFDGTKRERDIGIAIGGRGYIGFGHDSGTVVLHDWWEYDPGTDSWTQKASLPGSGRRDAVGFAIGTKGYVGTGDNSSNAQIGSPLSDFYQYDPSTNSWSAKASYPGGFNSGVYYATGFTVSGKGYICCGKVGSANYLDELWQYDPASDQWTSKASFPGGQRYGLSSFVCGNFAYAGLGVDYNVLLRDFWKYDPALDQWTQVANLPASQRYSSSGFAIGPEGFIVCGSDGGYKAELWEYSSTYDVWVQRADFAGGPTRSAAAFTIGTKGYCGTGLSISGSRRDLYEYTPLPPLGINDLTDKKISLQLFPDPMISEADLLISSNISLKNLDMKIFDVSGKLLHTEIFSGNNVKITRGNLVSGIYFISVSEEKEILATQKLIIQ